MLARQWMGCDAPTSFSLSGVDPHYRMRRDARLLPACMPTCAVLRARVHAGQLRAPARVAGLHAAAATARGLHARELHSTLGDPAALFYVISSSKNRKAFILGLTLWSVIHPMEEKIVQLAALLHDIGKFWQGAGERGKHAELSSRFIQEYVPEQWHGAAGIVTLHHDPADLQVTYSHRMESCRYG